MGVWFYGSKPVLISYDVFALGSEPLWTACLSGPDNPETEDNVDAVTLCYLPHGLLLT